MGGASAQGQGPKRVSAFDQFVKFVTDASGLERTFRLLQAITQILSSYEPVRQITLLLLTHITSLILPLILFPVSSPETTAGFKEQPNASSSPEESSATELIHSLLSIPTLLALRSSFALGRRFFRVGRFLDSFKSAWRLYTSSSSSSNSQATSGSGGLQTLQTYLTIFSSSFNGLYLLLETLHFPEVLLATSTTASSAVVGEAEKQLTSLWGPDLARTLHVEGQRFWFFALVCGAAAGTVKLINLAALRAVPSQGSGQNLDFSSLGVDNSAGYEKEESEELERVRKEQKESQARERQEFTITTKKVGRRVIAELLDLVLPGTVVGWVEMSSGMVGVCMLASTWLTGLEVWEKCGGV